ncbi:MAG: lipoyl synthase [Candidatus Goldbacteria bacterium]|nr:lipoyl synthase [Candidatus Goldiibacteriota bacterium]
MAEDIKRPEWAKKKIDFKNMHNTETALRGMNLHTVCHSARCPNISECYARGTAVFLILGNNCTRNCMFCNVTKAKPETLDLNEAERVITAAKKLKLKYLVVTSVTRDDLKDGGASVFADIIRKAIIEGIKIEVLVPDFKGNAADIKTVVDAMPDVFAHNIEVVPSLYQIRKGASYERSLDVLKTAKKLGAKKTKSGIMLGLGETEAEVLKTLDDIRGADVDYISIGQYLRPAKENAPVVEYLKPERFEFYKLAAMGKGFKHAESGVFVRSSYMADTYGKK